MSIKPKVTMIETPTQKLINKESVCLEFKDSLGRMIKIKEPDVLDEYDLSRALGKDAENMACLAISVPLLYIDSIDGEPLGTPQTYREVRALLKRVGKNTINEVLKNCKEAGFLKTSEEAEEEKEKLKKL